MILLLSGNAFKFAIFLTAYYIWEWKVVTSDNRICVYRDGKRGYDVQETIDEVMQDMKGVHRLDKSTITIDATAIPDEIVTLEPAQ